MIGSGTVKIRDCIMQRRITLQLTKSRKAYFKAAKSMSELSNFKQYHIGCIAVYKHKIISSGYNSNRTNPKQKSLNKYRFNADTKHTLHAELACLIPLISRYDIEFKDVELYIYREHKNGELALARPCAGCQALIRELGIKSIYYTNDGGYSHEIIY